MTPPEAASSRFVSPVPYLIRRGAELNPDTGRWADCVEIGSLGAAPHTVAAVLDEHNDVLAFIINHNGDAVPPQLIRSIAIAEYGTFPRPLATLQWPTEAELLVAADIRVRARDRRGRWGTMYVTIEATPTGARVLSSRPQSDLSRVVVTDSRLSARHREYIADLVAWIAGQATTPTSTSS